MDMQYECDNAFPDLNIAFLKLFLEKRTGRLDQSE